MTRYAAGTEISIPRRREEIERTLARYGCTAFGFAASGDKAQIVFELAGRRMRVDVPLPGRQDKAITHTATGKKRSDGDQARAFDQAARQRWAALSLYLKAVCEAIDNELVDAQTAFLPYVVLPDGQTLGEKIAPSIEAAYASGTMPALMAGNG